MCPFKGRTVSFFSNFVLVFGNIGWRNDLGKGIIVANDSKEDLLENILNWQYHWKKFWLYTPNLKCDEGWNVTVSLKFEKIYFQFNVRKRTLVITGHNSDFFAGRLFCIKIRVILIFIIFVIIVKCSWWVPTPFSINKVK